ncbi:MAG: nicotinate phosphoribosyltransferase [Chloroflexota bacterium]
MNKLNTRTNQGILFTDQYQLTMAQLYYRMGLHELTAQFDHFYRRNPDYSEPNYAHKAGYCINAGLESLVHWMQQTRFCPVDIEYMRRMQTNTGAQLFANDFLVWLAEHGHFGNISLQAVPEGRVIHPNTPLTVVQGPLAMAQILETALLNYLNYPILVATKAARVAHSAGGNPVLEFGLRRGQEQGANAGTRAALIGGAGFTSNAGVSHSMGIPPEGTHAHSMIQLFMSLGLGELGAFQAYADLYPDDCLLLVDTVDTLGSGVPNAIQVFEKLQRKGHKPVGVRLDSGDLAALSIKTAKLLNDAGFEDVSIVLSSDLDELAILRICEHIAKHATQHGQDADHVINRLVYGVGTRLVTSWGEPALGGVYKIVAVKHGNEWKSAVKISENPIKTPNPGQKRLWRLYDQAGMAMVDLVALVHETPNTATNIVLNNPLDGTTMQTIDRSALGQIELMLQDVFVDGQLIYELPELTSMRSQREADMVRLPAGVKEIESPAPYPVAISPALWQFKSALMNEVKPPIANRRLTKETG